MKLIHAKIIIDVHNIIAKLYSAQLMLDKFSLVELLAMDLHQLKDNLPWIPVKILKVSSVAITISP